MLISAVRWNVVSAWWMVLSFSVMQLKVLCLRPDSCLRKLWRKIFLSLLSSTKSTEAMPVRKKFSMRYMIFCWSFVRMRKCLKCRCSMQTAVMECAVRTLNISERICMSFLTASLITFHLLYMTMKNHFRCLSAICPILIFSAVLLLERSLTVLSAQMTLSYA